MREPGTAQWVTNVVDEFGRWFGQFFERTKSEQASACRPGRVSPCMWTRWNSPGSGYWRNSSASTSPSPSSRRSRASTRCPRAYRGCARCSPLTQRSFRCSRPRSPRGRAVFDPAPQPERAPAAIPRSIEPRNPPAHYFAVDARSGKRRLRVHGRPRDRHRRALPVLVELSPSLAYSHNLQRLRMEVAYEPAIAAIRVPIRPETGRP
jgi:hypothetical protein